MSSITRFLLNLSIGAKLGIASGLSILLVFAMVVVQIRAECGDAWSRCAQVGAADDREGHGGCESVDARHADRRPRCSSRHQSGGFAKSQ